MEIKKAVSRFKIKSASEDIFSRGKGEQKLTSGKYTMEYSGDLTGEGVLMELKNYSSVDSASIYGLERINATLEGRSGSFVLEHIGLYSKGIVISKRTIVARSVTGELAGLRGEANFSSEDADSFEITLDYYFD
jgi:hypothetical protein